MWIGIAVLLFFVLLIPNDFAFAQEPIPQKDSTLQYGTDEYGNIIKRFAVDRPFFFSFDQVGGRRKFFATPSQRFNPDHQHDAF